jgi:LPS-assembly protein
MPAALRRTLALLLVCACASAARAQTEPADDDLRGFGEDPIELTADALDYDAKQELYVASGNVELRQGARTLRADWIQFNRVTGIGVANGNVELREGDEVVRADHVEFDVDERLGFVRNGTIDSPAGQFRASGEEIRKTGPNSYSFKRAVFTTCRCPKEGSREPWQIRAREADLNIGGYGVVRDATFDVLGVPALWVPWLIVPLRTERQSGFLLPEVSAGTRRGFEIGTPFFWAARENVNVTLTPYYSVRRGFKGDVSTEYLLGQESSGDLFGAFAYDQEIRPHSKNEPFGRERWSLIGTQKYALPEDLAFHSDFRFVSDNDYPLDFQELRSRRAERWLQSWALLDRSFGESGRLVAEGSARFADDMQSPDDVDRDGSVLDRLPELALAGLPGALGPIPWLRPSFDASYVWFQATDAPGNRSGGFRDTGVDGVFNRREDIPAPAPGVDPHADDFSDVPGPAFNPGGTERNGRFDEGEPLTDEGSRVRLTPRLAAPFTLGDVFEIYPEVGWSETLYDTRVESFDQRGLFTGRVDARTRLRRRYTNAVHLIEPVVGYAYVGRYSQGGNPLLEPGTALEQQRVRDLDLDSVTRDTADRIPGANRVTWGAVQRLRLLGEGDAALEAELTLLGSYEIEDGEFGWIIADGGFEPSRYGATRFHVSYDPEKTQVSEGLAEWSWRHPAGHRIGLGYRYLRDIPDVFENWKRGERFDNFDRFDHIDQVFTELRVQATQRWLLGYKTSFSFDREVFLQNAGLIEYMSRCNCWAAGVELSSDRASGVDVRLIYRLVGLGDDLADSPLLDSLEGL